VASQAGSQWPASDNQVLIIITHFARQWSTSLKCNFKLKAMKGLAWLFVSQPQRDYYSAVQIPSEEQKDGSSSPSANCTPLQAFKGTVRVITDDSPFAQWV
jgi:hypothetical protein